MKKILSRIAAVLLSFILLIAPASALSVEQALQLLEEVYLYEIPEEAYAAQDLDELFAILNEPYTTYMTEEQYKAFLGLVEGDTNVVGIGVTIQYTDQGLLVESVLPGGSAEEGGIRAGDLIVEIGGLPCVPADESHRALILGEEGTTVNLAVLRDGFTYRYTLTRKPVLIPNTQAQVLEGGIGYIDCNSFGSETSSYFAAELEQYDDQVDCWLVDLRGNSGGYTDAAVDLCSLLTGPGRYLYLEDGSGDATAYTGMLPALTDKPVILLLNGGSASSSEILASSIRDIGRGVSVGGRTYGKGVAQIICDQDNVIPGYFDGDGMKVTAYRFYSAGFNTTDRIGVIPTLLVDDWYTEAVALALCGNPSDAKLSVVLDPSNGNDVISRNYYHFSINPDTDEAVLAALLAALPPQAMVGYSGVAGWWQDLYSAPQIAEMLGIEYESRWFNDVADSPYADAINALGTYYLINGVEEGRFAPKNTLTRAQLCVMLARALDVTYTGPTLFDDVANDAWYAGEVNAMAYLGLVDGVADGQFNPGGSLTQEQLLTILGRLARFLNYGMDLFGEYFSADMLELTEEQAAALAPFSSWAQEGAALLA